MPSSAWKYFRKNGTTNATCLDCGKVLNIKLGTTSLIYHLKMKHECWYKRYLEERGPQKPRKKYQKRLESQSVVTYTYPRKYLRKTPIQSGRGRPRRTPKNTAVYFRDRSHLKGKSSRVDLSKLQKPWARSRSQIGNIVKTDIGDQHGSTSVDDPERSRSSSPELCANPTKQHTPITNGEPADIPNKWSKIWCFFTPSSRPCYYHCNECGEEWNTQGTWSSKFAYHLQMHHVDLYRQYRQMSLVARQCRVNKMLEKSKLWRKRTFPLQRRFQNTEIDVPRIESSNLSSPHFGISHEKRSLDLIEAMNANEKLKIEMAELQLRVNDDLGGLEDDERRSSVSPELGVNPTNQLTPTINQPQLTCAPRSKIWQFFRLSKNDFSIYLCNKCDKQLKVLGRHTDNLIAHLRFSHDDLHRQFRQLSMLADQCRESEALKKRLMPKVRVRHRKYWQYHGIEKDVSKIELSNVTPDLKESSNWNLGANVGLGSLEDDESRSSVSPELGVNPINQPTPTDGPKPTWPTRSEVWQFYTQSKNDALIYHCNECGKHVKIQLRKHVVILSGHLIRHLREYHVDLHRQFIYRTMLADQCRAKATLKRRRPMSKVRVHPRKIQKFHDIEEDVPKIEKSNVTSPDGGQSLDVNETSNGNLGVDDGLGGKEEQPNVTSPHCRSGQNVGCRRSNRGFALIEPGIINDASPDVGRKRESRHCGQSLDVNQISDCNLGVNDGLSSVEEGQPMSSRCKDVQSREQGLSNFSTVSVPPNSPIETFFASCTDDPLKLRCIECNEILTVQRGSTRNCVAHLRLTHVELHRQFCMMLKQMAKDQLEEERKFWLECGISRGGRPSKRLQKRPKKAGAAATLKRERKNRHSNKMIEAVGDGRMPTLDLGLTAAELDTTHDQPGQTTSSKRKELVEQSRSKCTTASIPPNSHIWTFFAPCTDDSMKLCCIECDETVAIQRGSVRNCVSHLRLNHVESHRQFCMMLKRMAKDQLDEVRKLRLQGGITRGRPPKRRQTGPKKAAGAATVKFGRKNQDSNKMVEAVDDSEMPTLDLGFTDVDLDPALDQPADDQPPSTSGITQPNRNKQLNWNTSSHELGQSQIFKYFIASSDHPFKYRCIECDQIVVKQFGGTTSWFIDHLQSFHVELYRQFQRLSKQKPRVARAGVQRGRRGRPRKIRHQVLDVEPRIELSPPTPPVSSTKLSRKLSPKMMAAITAVIGGHQTVEMASMKFGVSLGALNLQLCGRSSSLAESVDVEFEPPVLAPAPQEASTSTSVSGRGRPLKKQRSPSPECNLERVKSISAEDAEPIGSVSLDDDSIGNVVLSLDASSPGNISSVDDFICVKECPEEQGSCDVIFEDIVSEYLEDDGVEKLCAYFRELIEVDIKITTELGLSVVASVLLEKGFNQIQIDTMLTNEWWQLFCFTNYIVSY